MQFNPSLMPKTLVKDAIYIGLEDSKEVIKSKTQLERAILLKTRRNRQEITTLAEEYFSQFSGRMQCEAFQNNLGKMNNNTELLVLVFGLMLIPLSDVMKSVDIRNKGTAEFINEFSALDFNTVTLRSMNCNLNHHPQPNAEFDVLTDDLVISLKHSKKQYKLSIDQMGICFAEAFKRIHPTIQQNFIRTFCQTAAILTEKQLQNEIKIESAPLLQVLSAISCTEKRHFSYV